MSLLLVRLTAIIGFLLTGSATLASIGAFVIFPPIGLLALFVAPAALGLLVVAFRPGALNHSVGFRRYLVASTLLSLAFMSWISIPFLLRS
jgi:hypothetical protein